MATLSDFFFRRPRPQPPAPPGRGEPTGERLVAEVDEALAAFDVPGELVENLKTDLKKALKVEGRFPPAYKPGAVAAVGFNLIDAITDPVKTAQETIASVFEDRKRPSVPLLWTDAEDVVWRRVFDAAGVDQMDRPIVSLSLRQSILLWNGRARVRVTRLLAEEKGILQSPGLTLMMSQRLNAATPGAAVAGVPLTTIINEASQFEAKVARSLQAGEWDKAGDAQKDWVQQSKPYRENLIKEFERQSRLRQDVANTPEGQFWRYWQNRKHYFETLNFLSTCRDKGFWGTAKTYAWDKAVLKIFGMKPDKDTSPLARLWYYGYPARTVNWLQEKTIGALLKRPLTALTKWRQGFANFWKKVIKDPLTKGIEWIRDKVVRRIAGWVAMKLGITGLGAALGSVVPGAGTALGAVLSAIGSFLVETAISKMGGVWRVAAFGVVGGLSLVFAALMIAASFLIILVGLIFNTNAALPSAVTSVPITVTKEACEPAPSCDEFHNPLQILKDGLVHSIRWRITIKNTGEADELINWGDDYCQPYPSEFPIPIGPGGEITVFCNQNITANEDKVVTNTVRGTTTPATAPFSGTGAVIVGEPETAFPIGWPLAHGCITQGPNASYSHTGDEAIDIDRFQAGLPVFATHRGVVVRHCYTLTGCTNAYGNYVRVRSSAGFETVYAHLTDVYVTTGDPIFFGRPVGTVGETGNAQGIHLHYEFLGLEMAPPYIPQEVSPCLGRDACGICW